MEKAFWLWFVEHEAELWRFDPEQVTQRELLFERVEAELNIIDSRLTFEFGPKAEVRDFVLSADGHRVAFPSVVRLKEAAPELPRWNIIAFRPRRGPHGAIAMNGVEIRGEDITFTLLEKGAAVGLRVFLPGYTDDNPSMKSIAYLFLDEALGEYDVEMGLSLIRFHALLEPTMGDRHPLARLPAMFDQLVARVRGASGKFN